MKPVHLSLIGVGALDFGSRAALISAVEAVSLDAIRSYYRDTVLTDNPSRILIQIRGERWQGEPFAEIEGAVVVDSVEVPRASVPRR